MVTIISLYILAKFNMSVQNKESADGYIAGSVIIDIIGIIATSTVMFELVRH